MKRKRIVYLSLVIVLICALTAGITVLLTQNKQLQTPQNLLVEKRILTWDKVENASGYVISIRGKEYETSECRFELYFLSESSTYKVEVMALGDWKRYTDSNWASTLITLEAPVAHGYDQLGYEYTLLEDKTGYEVSRGNANLQGEITIPDYFGDYPVKRIAEYAFTLENYRKNCFTEGNCNIVTTGINLPKHLESIGKSSMAYMVRLEKIVIPDTVKEIGGSAFYGNTHMRSVVLPKGLKEIPPACFQETGLSSITLPETLEIIEHDAFRCTTTDFGSHVWHINSELSSVVIPESVTSIEDLAFNGRENLQSITFLSTKNITTFGKWVFEDTLWYKQQPDGPIYFGNLLYRYKGEMPNELIVPSTVKGIVGGAFLVKTNGNLQKVVLPKGLKIIGTSAFQECRALNEVILPEDLEVIPSGTFSQTPSLKSIELPDSITVMDDAFDYSGLTSISIPSGVKTISGFAGCTELSEVELPNTAEIIAEDAFARCSSLKSITLPSSLKEIGRSAFSGSGLTSIEIPDSVITMYKLAFNQCRNLEEITIPVTVAKFIEGSFFCLETPIKIINFKGTKEQWEQNIPEDFVLPDGVTLNFLA